VEKNDDEECDEEGVAGDNECNTDNCEALVGFSKVFWEVDLRMEWKMIPASRFITLIFSSMGEAVRIAP
jgi:uncharacterized membrane protein